MKEGLIPQGLRWQLPLNSGEEDSHDTLAWENFQVYEAGIKESTKNVLQLRLTIVTTLSISGI